MDLVPKLYIVLPALDEAPNIPRVFSELHEFVGGRQGLTPSVVLVDDGSTDGTGEAAREAAAGLELRVLRHEQPQGPGRAFATAFEELAGRLDADDLVLTLEADNTSRLDILDAMLHRLGEGYDTVLASPYMYGGAIVQTDPFRVLISHVANAFVKEFLGIHGLMTVSSFYRLYRGSLLSRLQESYGPMIVERPGFECMVEMTLKMVYLDATISEVPLVLDSSRRVGRSKMRVARTARGYLGVARHKQRWQRAAKPLAAQ